MLHVALPEADKEVLAEERFVHPHPRVQQRMWVVWLKGQGFAHQDIARAMGVTDDTVTSYLTLYLERGLEGLRTITFHRPASELQAHQTTLEAHFRAHPPATVAEAQAEVKRLTGVERSPTQIGVFLRRMGMRCRKVAAVPAKVDVDAQEAFKKKTWNLA